MVQLVFLESDEALLMVPSLGIITIKAECTKKVFFLVLVIKGIKIMIKFQTMAKIGPLYDLRNHQK